MVHDTEVSGPQRAPLNIWMRSRSSELGWGALGYFFVCCIASFSHFMGVPRLVGGGGYIIVYLIQPDAALIDYLAVCMNRIIKKWYLSCVVY